MQQTLRSRNLLLSTKPIQHHTKRDIRRARPSVDHILEHLPHTTIITKPKQQPHENSQRRQTRPNSHIPHLTQNLQRLKTHPQIQKPPQKGIQDGKIRLVHSMIVPHKLKYFVGSPSPNPGNEPGNDVLREQGKALGRQNMRRDAAQANGLLGIVPEGQLEERKGGVAGV